MPQKPVDKASSRKHVKAKEEDLRIQWGLRIPMRDGVHLNATLYKPISKEKPLPVIFTLTPYISDSYHERGSFFAKNGYHFALIDVRGRGNSEGVFEPFANEARDGHDIVEWLAAQPFCDGHVAMWGGSYAGYDQWATAKELPPHLSTIVPAASGYPGVDFPYWNNVFYSYETQWATFTSGLTGNQRLFEDYAYWISAFREMYLQQRPFQELDQIAGNPSPVFQRWLKHPTPDAYFDALTPSDAQLRRMQLPILTITGHYDDDQPGAMTFYQRYMQLGTPKAKARHYLIIGPWDHPGTRTPNREVGGLAFGEASLVNLNQLHKEWYDWTMKRGSKPKFLQDRVAWYVPGEGAEVWKYASSFEAIPTFTQELYLDSSDGVANDAFHSGQLSSKKPRISPPDQYTYDPRDLRPAELEREWVKNFITDQRYALNLLGNGLIYHGEPYSKGLEITGYVKLVLWMSLDVPDTDFHVELFEIQPDGRSIFLTHDLMRARYRKSLRREELIREGAIEPYEFQSFTFFSRRLSKLSRLRLLIRSPNSIYYEKNYNSGGKVAEESGKDARVAHVKLFHDRNHPSRLEIPVAK